MYLQFGLQHITLQSRHLNFSLIFIIHVLQYLLHFDGDNLIITISGEYPSRGIPNFTTNLISNNSKKINYTIKDNTINFIKTKSKYFLILLIFIIVILVIITYFIFIR